MYIRTECFMSSESFLVWISQSIISLKLLPTDILNIIQDYGGARNVQIKRFSSSVCEIAGRKFSSDDIFYKRHSTCYLNDAKKSLSLFWAHVAWGFSHFIKHMSYVSYNIEDSIVGILLSICGGETVWHANC